MDTSIKNLRARRAVLIESLAKESRDADLRQFAVWCARQTDLTRTNWGDLPDSAEAHAVGDWSLAEMLDVRNRHAGSAMPASVVGLNRGAANAAAFLSAWQTTRQDAAEAAAESAKMAAIWKGMKAGRQRLAEDDSTVEVQIEELTRLVAST